MKTLTRKAGKQKSMQVKTCLVNTKTCYLFLLLPWKTKNHPIRTSNHSTKYRSSQNPAKFASRNSSTMSRAQNLLLDLRSLGSGRGARIEAGIRYRRVTSARQTEKRNKRRYGMHLYASKIFQVFHHVLHTFCIKKMHINKLRKYVHILLLK